MIVFHELIFDEPINGTAATYTAAKWNALLAKAASVEGVVAISQVSGSPVTLTVASEISADGRVFGPKYNAPEINAVTLDAADPRWEYVRDFGTMPTSAFRRFRLELGGSNPKAYIKMWVTGRCELTPIPPDRALMSSDDVARPAANTAAVVTYAAAGTGARHCITGVAWSYTSAPTNGGLIIQDGSSLVFSVAIVAAGPGSIGFPVPKVGAPGASLTVTLAAGGAAIAGEVSVLGHFIDFIGYPP